MIFAVFSSFYKFFKMKSFKTIITKKWTWLLILQTIPLLTSAQSLLGRVYDSDTQEPLPGVSILYKDAQGKPTGTVSASDGGYNIKLPAKSVDVTFSCLGYEDQTVRMILADQQEKKLNIFMKLREELLSEVVVSAGRFEQKLSDITVSMDLIKGEAISRQAPTDITSTLNMLPGVDINDRQPSIRGGNGWTYGVGSRSQVLIDGMNALDPSNGTVNWNFLPMENIDQVEVMKGASSVLYGSSALNGIINIRSKRPSLTPVTSIKTYIGIYDNPAQDSYRWYDKSFWKEGKFSVKPFLRNILPGIRNPFYEGIDFSHTRRIGDFDISASINLFTDEGYRQQGYNKRLRAGGNLTYHQPLQSELKLNYGFNLSFLSDQSADFFIWRSPSQVYQPSAFANMGREGNTLDINPFLNLTDPNNNTIHRIKARFHYRDNNIVQGSEPKSIANILGDMGTDIEALGGLVKDIQNKDFSVLKPIIGPLLGGNMEEAVNQATGILGNYFPTATTADYCDLLSWIMKHGLPEGKQDLVQWLSQVVSPTPAPTHVDRDYTYYLDYQFNKKWDRGPQLTAGMTYEHTRITSQKTGIHNSDNVAVFAQYDQRFWDRLSVSAGMRVEYYRVDDFKREAESKFFGTTIPVHPIFRAGLNWQMAEYTFLRASFGQGYRYPSLTEKYARKDIGGVGVYPNKDLKAEKGYNAEIGFKQGYKFGNVKGQIDLAGFYTQYSDMIEFRFGFFNNNTYEYITSLKDVMNMVGNKEMPGLGAQFYNVSKARIYGAEVSTQGIWEINPDASLTYNLGYVFLEPEDIDYKNKNLVEDGYTDPLQMKEKSNTSKYLKYRQQHTAKAVVDFNWKRLNLGFNLVYKSKTPVVDYIMIDERKKEAPEAMDYVRDLLFGVSDGQNLASYWEQHNKPYCVGDLRLGLQLTEKVSTQISVNNLWNQEYSTRPMAVAAPRSYILQLSCKF